MTKVRPGEPIDLTGVYPGGEGAVLRVQRLEDGAWVDFADGSVEATVSNETFSTYVVTERTGPQHLADDRRQDPRGLERGAGQDRLTDAGRL